MIVSLGLQVARSTGDEDSLLYNIVDGHCVVVTDRSHQYQNFDLLEDGGKSFSRFGQVSHTRRLPIRAVAGPNSFPWQSGWST